MKRHVAALVAIVFLAGLATRPETAEPLAVQVSQFAAVSGASLTGAPPSLPAVPNGAQEPILSVPANHDGAVGTRLVHARGTWAYANASHGSLYLAIPEGRGWIVEVCGPLGCRERVSTDAGPELWLQRAGRIGDLSSADFIEVCGPLGPGLCRGGSYTILGAADQSGDDPPRHEADDRMRAEDAVTAPPTDVDR